MSHSNALAAIVSRLGVAVAIFSVAVGAAAQEKDPGYTMSAAEQRASLSLMSTMSEIVSSRLQSSPAAPRGVDVSGDETLQGRVGEIPGVMSEELGYRVGSSISAVLDSFQPMKIIDGDWTQVSDPTVTPYKACCHIKTYWNATDSNGNQIVTQGTATFVGKRVLVTNSHNVWSSAYGGWANRVLVEPARNGNDRKFGSQACKKFAVPKPWSHGEEGDRDYDMAWLIMPDRTLNDRVGYYMGYQTSKDNDLTAWTLNSMGYPEAQSRGYKMHRDSESKDQVVSAKQFRHYHDTLGGSSGSPVYAKFDSSRYIVGVHCAGANGYNVATRMTKSYFDLTKDFKAKYP